MEDGSERQDTLVVGSGVLRKLLFGDNDEEEKRTVREGKNINKRIIFLSTICHVTSHGGKYPLPTFEADHSSPGYDPFRVHKRPERGQHSDLDTVKNSVQLRFEAILL